MRKVMLFIFAYVALIVSPALFAGEDDNVIAISISANEGVADAPNKVRVTSKSPGGCDLSELKYCLCDEMGKELVRYRNAVGVKPADLMINLPAGKYVLKATDGTWYYGGVPYVLKPSVKSEGKSKEAIEWEKRPKGYIRAWTDIKNFDKDNLDKHQKRMSK